MKTARSIKILILLYLFHAVAWADIQSSSYRVRAGVQEFQVEIADSVRQKERGLMYRRSLPPSHGLLMVFQQDRAVPIWMKNMHFPLDVVWISAAGVVVDRQTLQPCTQNPCPLSWPQRPVRFVLEVGAGLFPLNQGDKVEIIDASGDSLLPSVSGLESNKE